MSMCAGRAKPGIRSRASSSPGNVDEQDALLLSGETRVAVPEQTNVGRVRTLPPWERL